jgi:hypothetical protein
VAAQISRHVVVFDALRPRDSVAEHLQIGVDPSAEIVAKWVDAEAWGARLVFLGKTPRPAPSISVTAPTFHS